MIREKLINNPKVLKWECPEVSQGGPKSQILVRNRSNAFPWAGPNQPLVYLVFYFITSFINNVSDKVNRLMRIFFGLC